MNFKKIALVVAMASSFAAHADIDITSADYTTAGAVLAAQVVVVPELLNTVAGNTAYVIQEGVDAGGNVAYISQTDTGNYAAVLQQGMGALAFVTQSGTAGNRAVVVSIDATGTTPRADGLDVATANVADLAKAEILAASLSSTGNVALLTQVADAESNTAYIYQNGTNNFAAITQTAGAAPNVAVVSQLGGGNRAYIAQSN